MFGVLDGIDLANVVGVVISVLGVGFVLLGLVNAKDGAGAFVVITSLGIILVLIGLWLLGEIQISSGGIDFSEEESAVIYRGRL